MKILSQCPDYPIELSPLDYQARNDIERYIVGISRTKNFSEVEEKLSSGNWIVLKINRDECNGVTFVLGWV